MKTLILLLPLVFAWMTSCSSKPTLVISGSLGKHDLRGKTLAVGGFTAQDLMVYPGQVAEAAIVADAGTALQHRFKPSQVLTVEAVRAAAGSPPTKFSSHVPVVIGSKLTANFIRKTRAHGMDYLLWIDLLDNSVENGSNQWVSTRTESSSCSCTKKNGAKCSSSSCGSSCQGSCCRERTVKEYNSATSATRTLLASYSLLNTTTGKAVWRADAKLARSNNRYANSESGFPALPKVPLPPMEAEIMKRMTTAAIARLPK
ncbi:MAG: hypothetical protein K9N47_27345 [Prosthecobacter sp.]|uniref:hypothetical protein n=1 Tax=Prosthecobacter sp. TaxID=1965333 RepID=UPI002615D5EE|nr:hypothetical protein [Prosthecobacter sp.]MCF7789869.1 hypothetical protein [Prosthecobacter sp.]